MAFKTHNDDMSISAGGTCGQGFVASDYANIVRVFGKPIVCRGYKTDAEWIILFDDGKIASIYNYKTGKNYLGPDGLDVEDITYWHIGGSCRSVKERILLLLSDDWGAFESIRQSAVLSP